MNNKEPQVFCYFNAIIPLVIGHVIPSELQYKNEPYTRVRWNQGGISYFPNKHVFYSREDWETFYDAERKRQAAELEQIEYETYLKLKAKYEGENTNERKSS